MALSEGPLPLTIEGVKHFKSVHEATGAPGLSGCRLEIDGQRIASLRARWSTDAAGLRRMAQHWDLDTVVEEVAIPVIEGLSASSKRAPRLTVEAAYDPEPVESLVLELGPVSARESLGLCNALFGAEPTAALTALARDLSASRFLAIRLRLERGGPTSMTALAAPPSRTTRLAW